MTGRSWTTWTTVAAAALLAAGCNLFSKSGSPTGPGSATTATFSGTLAPKGTPVFFTFTAAAGPVAVTLTSLNPTSTTGIGLGIGTPSGTTACSLSNFTTSAMPSNVAQLTVTENDGSYCVQVYDPGGLGASTAFTIAVSHF
jgi:hypothetical protein